MHYHAYLPMYLPMYFVLNHFFSFLQGSPKVLRAPSGSSFQGPTTSGKGSSSCLSTDGPDGRSFYAAPVSSSPLSRRARLGRCTSCRSLAGRYVKETWHTFSCLFILFQCFMVYSSNRKTTCEMTWRSVCDLK